MLYREIIAVCSQIHTKHINTLCGQNVELLNAKPGGTYSDHWAVQSQRLEMQIIETRFFLTSKVGTPIRSRHKFASALYSGHPPMQPYYTPTITSCGT